MRILGIETATAVCSAGLIIDEQHRLERSLEAPQVHSQKLLTLINDVLRTSEIEIGSLDGIAVSIGPGSFTGLRIGLSVAKGLAYASGKPLLAVSTLKALANSAYEQYAADKPVLVIIDSRKNEAFYALYRMRDTILTEEIAPSAGHYSELETICSVQPDILLTGSGSGKFFAYYKNNLERDIQLTILPEEQRNCSALSICALGGQLLRNNVVADLASIEPLYIKDFYTLSQQQQPIGT